LTVSERHTWWGEAFGTVCFLWIFHRARHDLGVVLGLRHPWEHSGDDHGGHGGAEESEKLRENWDKFSAKAVQQREDDDDEDDDE
jgi:hypothetical protein